MIWLLAVVVLIALGLFLWMKRGASNVNNYFSNAVTVYAIAGEDAARIAAVTAAKVAAAQQRASMLVMLRRIASDVGRLPGGELIRHRLLEIADEIAAKDWTTQDIRIQKALLGEANPDYLIALNNFDPDVFSRKWPSLFNSAKARALEQLQEALETSVQLTSEEKAIVSSPSKLRDMVQIPDDAMQIIGEYGKTLAEDQRLLHPISLLPYPKDTIKKAIETALKCAEDREMRQHLHVVLFALDDFVPDEKVPQDPEENTKAWWVHRSRQGP